MNDEHKENSYTSLPEEIRKLIASENGRNIVKYFSEHPDTLQTATEAGELHEKAAEVIKNSPEIQQTIRRIQEKIWRDGQKIRTLFDARDAADQAALSGTVGNFKIHASKVQDFQRAMGVPTWEYLKYIQEDSPDNTPLPEEARQDAIKQEQIFNNLIDELVEVKFLLKNFLDNFKRITRRNERASKINVFCSKWLSIIAIFISVIGILANISIPWYFSRRAEKNDKTGELIEVVKRFHADHNAQNKNEVTRLRAKYEEIESQLAEARKKNNELISARKQEQQQSQREINELKMKMASLERHVKELNRPSISKTVPAAPEVKK